jgi:hypothetical protein
MHLSSISKSIPSSVRALALAGVALMAAHGSAHATAGVWDSAALGYSGNGSNSANAWITTPGAGNSYAEWNVILSYPTDNTPDIAGAGTLTELTGGAFPTSGGNIYGLGGPTSFQVDLAGSTTGLWEVYLRVGTQGSIALEEATLNGVSATRVLTYDNVITGGFGGAEQESLWKWTLAGTGNWVFNFGASAAHMSLDQIAVYAVQQAPAVPEPQTWALMGAGLGAMALVRRRRQAR